MELWDAYDKNFNIINGISLVRGEVIPEGMYHLVCDVYVRHTDGDILLMQRDFNKTHGGCWEATAGGSALKGENPLECAIRELYEETGIEEYEITELGKVVCEKHKSIYVEFLVVTNCDKSNIRLQEGETIDFKWIKESKLNHFEGTLITDRILKFLK